MLFFLRLVILDTCHSYVCVLLYILGTKGTSPYILGHSILSQMFKIITVYAVFSGFFDDFQNVKMHTFARVEYAFQHTFQYAKYSFVALSISLIAKSISFFEKYSMPYFCL